MVEKIIGHGTWYDKVALQVIEKERELGRSLDLVRTESGLGASGIPHIGSLADAVRSHAVTLALETQGYKSELVAFSDDKDGLRNVPAGLPKSLKKYLGYPVTSIPDPYGCHGSYGEHMSSLLLEALDTCGVEYTFMSGTELYKRGILNHQIRTLLTNARRVGEIIEDEIGQEKYVEELPYFPVCSNCGRIYTTRALNFSPKENKIIYECKGMEVKGRWLDGCGYKGEVDYKKGEGKLSWKVEFAARWAALGIRFEAYGKDIADSVRVNDRISYEVLDYSPPLHAQYEMFLDKSGRKISKSAGNVFTPQVWFRYGSPQSLILLTLKRFVGTRAISVTDIPNYMLEFDNLEDIYFGRKTISDEMELAKLTGLYQYCWMLKPPSKPNTHVPYNLLIHLVKVAPKCLEQNFIEEKLRTYGYIKNSVSENLTTRIGYVLKWVEDFTESKERALKLSDHEASAIKELIQILQVERDEDMIQGAIFNIARKYSVPLKRQFKILYTILLGSPEGPRLGPYIVTMGRQNVIDALNKALRKSYS